MKAAANVTAAPAAAKTSPAFAVSRPADVCEVQAETAATSVANGHSAHLPRESAPAQSLAASTGLAGAGQPLAEDTRREMEPAFGRGFSEVRVHADRRAGEVAQAWHANALTVGHDIVFAPGTYAPHTNSGRRLIAHELAHVAQGGAGVRRQPAPAPENFITAQSVQQLSDEELDRHIQGVIDRERGLPKASPEAKTLADNLAILEGELKRRGSASPVLVRELIIRGSAEVQARLNADLKTASGLFKATGSTPNAGGLDLFSDYFGPFANNQKYWIAIAGQHAGALAASAPINNRTAAFDLIGKATPRFLAAWGGERLMEVWVALMTMSDYVLRHIPTHSVEYQLMWLSAKRDEISKVMVELASADVTKIQVALEGLPAFFQKMEKDQKDLIVLIEKGQKLVQKILIVATVVQLVTSLYSMRGVFTFPKAPPPTGMAPAGVRIQGGVAVATSAVRPIEWADIVKKLYAAGLITMPIAGAAQQGGMIMMATGGSPGGAGGVGTPGTPPAVGGGSGGYTAPPSPRVTGGAKPNTAGSGGIASIDRTVDKVTGAAQTTIEGRLRPTLPARAGLEKLLGPTLPNADRAHLWGRILGDEAAAGTLYAPSNFNRGVQLTMEKVLRVFEQKARDIGGYVWLKASNRSHPRSVLNGKALKEVKYEVQVRTPDGRIVERTHVEFNNVAVPGTPVTKNRPGYTISAPFGGGTP